MDIACLSETFLDADCSVSLNNFSPIHKVRNGFGGRSVRRGIDFTNLADDPLVRSSSRMEWMLLWLK